MRHFLYAAAIAALSATGAAAATISVTDFSAGAYQAAVGPSDKNVVEDFESFSEGNVASGWSDSAVGTFSALGGTGSGGTVSGSTSSGNFAGNDGSQLAIRDGSVYGRSSTTAALSGDGGDDKFLDSNDTSGIAYEASLGGGMFDRIVLTLTDATDSGGLLNITVNGVTETISGLGDGAVQIVEIAFDSAVSTASILFENVDGNGNAVLNDGFSIDDVTLSAVPLPASAWLLIGGFGALAAMRRRKRAQA
ncbi:MAG: VPLPA-CTERM sorting domain-containing protein [Paracoccaceae bacterium]|nr:VPLPA-CTERM sorting domain-containing protein [Paracoccaceae bacterium]